MSKIYNFILKIFKQKYTFSYLLIGKITFIFLFFGIILILIILTDSFMLFVNTFEISTDNMLFSKIVNKITKSSAFSYFVGLLGATLTPNAEQLLGLLILSYTFIILLFILSFFLNIIMLPLICLIGGLFMAYLKLAGNWMLDSYTLFNYWGIKIIKMLTPEEKLAYLENLLLKYQNNLDERFIFKGFIWDNQQELNLLEQFKYTNDTDIIRDIFYKKLETYTQTLLTDLDIRLAIKQALSKLTIEDSKKFDPSYIFNEIKSNKLEGDKEIISFIEKYINDYLNSWHLTNLIEYIQIGANFINDYKWFILAGTLVIVIGGGIYYYYYTSSIAILHEATKGLVDCNKVVKDEFSANDTRLEALEKNLALIESSLKENFKTVDNDVNILQTDDINKTITEGISLQLKNLNASQEKVNLELESSIRNLTEKLTNVDFKIKDFNQQIFELDFKHQNLALEQSATDKLIKDFISSQQ